MVNSSQVLFSHPSSDVRSPAMAKPLKSVAGAPDSTTVCSFFRSMATTFPVMDSAAVEVATPYPLQTVFPQDLSSLCDRAIEVAHRVSTDSAGVGDDMDKSIFSNTPTS